MAERYQSLYRRYRPQRFAELRGQDHVTTPLRNAVANGRTVHAYLFSGPRGTGKTSTARIMAAALNCAKPVDGEPDGTCESCVAIRAGSSLDVVELDAASNNGVDAMRDLVARAALGSPGRWKIYIVDEVHMLTTAASNALLKTLEEPPGHVVFVLATTDPQKVLSTITSRTQNYEFRLLGPELLASLLLDVNDQADLRLDPETLDRVARRGNGSARDALSALDQAAAAGGAEDEAEAIPAVVQALAGRDVGAALVAVAEAAGRGRDPHRLAVEIVEHLRSGFLLTMAPDLAGVPEHQRPALADQARRLGPAATVRAMEVLGETLIAMRDALDTRVTLELALVRLCSPAADSSYAALVERVETLERRLAGGAAPPGPHGPAAAERSVGPGGASQASAELRMSEPRPPAAPAGGAGPSGRPSAPGPPPLAGRAQLAPARPGSEAGAAPSIGGVASEQPPVPASLAGPETGPAVESGPVAEVRGSLTAAPRSPADGPGSAPPTPPPQDRGPAPVASAASSRAVGGRPTIATMRQRRPGEGPSAASTSADSPAPAMGASGRSLQEAPGAGDEDEPAVVDRDELTKVWGDSVFASLSQGAKAVYRPGRWARVDGGVAVFTLPALYLDRAEERRLEVESALAGHLGARIPVRLEIEGSLVPTIGAAQVDVGAGAVTGGPSPSGPSPTGHSAPGPSPTGPSPKGQPPTGPPTGQPPTGPSLTGPQPTGQPSTGQPSPGPSLTGPQPTGQPSTGQPSPAGPSPAGPSPAGAEPARAEPARPSPSEAMAPGGRRPGRAEGLGALQPAARGAGDATPAAGRDGPRPTASLDHDDDHLSVAEFALLENAPTVPASAEARVLEAFPGTQEVQ